ncbi:MAG: hypothetical protein Q3997_01175 [Propionibacteriaceae bacterium]|nr:hypothetical protein [Propionibacteriaceae bacterium]
MIIRILGEGQFVMDEADLADLNTLDHEVEAAAQAGDQERLTRALSALIAKVRESGRPVEDDIAVESDLILPDETATVADIQKLLDDAAEYPGLIPG